MRQAEHINGVMDAKKFTIFVSYMNKIVMYN